MSIPHCASHAERVPCQASTPAQSRALQTTPDRAERAEREGADALKMVAARKVHTKLPSFTEQYTQSTPLTRIRDIAHRNDIPHELKQEIKHTIQARLSWGIKRVLQGSRA